MRLSYHHWDVSQLWPSGLGSCARAPSEDFVVVVVDDDALLLLVCLFCTIPSLYPLEVSSTFPNGTKKSLSLDFSRCSLRQGQNCLWLKRTDRQQRGCYNCLSRNEKTDKPLNQTAETAVIEM